MTIRADDFADDTTTTGTLAFDAPATGHIEEDGDRDWFAVELEAGKTYRFNLEARDAGKGTMSNPTLWGIYDADGTFIPGTKAEDKN